jgi:delta11-fatty-acid desaturase
MPPAPEASSVRNAANSSDTYNLAASALKKSENKRERPTKGAVNYETQKLITRIHGKYYDLTGFKHPGGPIAQAAIEGRDGTELFESHHLFTDKNVA